jgi:hypothetical protein
MSSGEVANQPYFVKEVGLAPAELAEEVHLMSIIAYSSVVVKGAITCHGGAIKRGQASMKRLLTSG